MARLEAFKAEYRRHCQERFDAACKDFERTRRADLPVGETHQLSDTFTVTVTGGFGNDVLTATAEMPVPYAIMLDKGTRPHVITPKTAKVLVFQSGGSTVFTQRVEHPGFPSQEIWEKPAPVEWQLVLEAAFS